MSKNAIILEMFIFIPSPPLTRHVWACQFLLGTFTPAAIMQASVKYCTIFTWSFHY